MPTAELTCKRPVAEGDAQGTSSKQGQPRKRARLETECISSSRNKPCRSKKAIPVGNPRKVAPSRVRKTYRNRQKIERCSPGRCVDSVVGDVDYDEIPLSAAVLNSPTAKGRILSPTMTRNAISTSKALLLKDTNEWPNLPGAFIVGPAPPVEILDNKKQEEMETPRQTDACGIQGSLAGLTPDDGDDDPIRSFSSSPSELMPLAINPVKCMIVPPCTYDLIFDLHSLGPKSQSLTKVFVLTTLP